MNVIMYVTIIIIEINVVHVETENKQIKIITCINYIFYLHIFDLNAVFYVSVTI